MNASNPNSSSLEDERICQGMSLHVKENLLTFCSGLVGHVEFATSFVNRAPTNHMVTCGTFLKGIYLICMYWGITLTSGTGKGKSVKTRKKEMKGLLK